MTVAAMKDSCQICKAVDDLMKVLSDRHPKEIMLAMARENFKKFHAGLEEDTLAAVSYSQAVEQPDPVESTEGTV